MRGLGQGIRQFKKGMTEEIEEEPKKAEKKDQPQGGSSIPPPAC
jgi:Sec-independent protein translocase protein TatA